MLTALKQHRTRWLDPSNATGLEEGAAKLSVFPLALQMINGKAKLYNSILQVMVHLKAQSSLLRRSLLMAVCVEFHQFSHFQQVNWWGRIWCCGCLGANFPPDYFEKLRVMEIISCWISNTEGDGLCAQGVLQVISETWTWRTATEKVHFSFSAERWPNLGPMCIPYHPCMGQVLWWECSSLQCCYLNRDSKIPK